MKNFNIILTPSNPVKFLDFHAILDDGAQFASTTHPPAPKHDQPVLHEPLRVRPLHAASQRWRSQSNGAHASRRDGPAAATARRSVPRAPRARCPKAHLRDAPAAAAAGRRLLAHVPPPAAHAAHAAHALADRARRLEHVEEHAVWDTARRRGLSEAHYAAVPQRDAGASAAAASRAAHLCLCRPAAASEARTGHESG